MSSDLHATSTTTTLSDQVGEEIRALMARRRISGAEMARRLGVSAAWVSYRLTGSQPIDLNDMERIAAILGVGIVDLIPRGRREVTVTFVDPPARGPHLGGRPSGGRPPGRSADLRPPSGPTRTSRVLRQHAA